MRGIEKREEIYESICVRLPPHSSAKMSGEEMRIICENFPKHLRLCIKAREEATSKNLDDIASLFSSHLMIVNF